MSTAGWEHHMSYVQEVLQPGEELRYQAAIHWVTYLHGIAWLLAALIVWFIVPASWREGYVVTAVVIILVACADTCWLILNILWAVGDLSKIPQALLTAKIFFAIGGLFCFIAFCLSEAGERLQFLILSRLRILKFFQRTRLI